MANLSTRTINGQDAGRLLQEMEKRERKRQQNRIAQQNYRRNQKQRLRALEAAVTTASGPSTAVLISPTPSNVSNDFFDVSTAVPASSARLADYNDAETAIDQPATWQAIETTWTDTGGTPPPFPSSEGRSALHRAVYIGNERISRLLVEKGADLTREDGNGCTALHLAAETGREALVQLLLDKSADPSRTDAFGRTALFSAIQGQNETVVKLILENGLVDVNMPDSLGNVPLHAAVESGSESIILLLLDHGANINA